MSSERTARFGIFLFGRFQLIGRGGPIQLTSKKHAALLAYLAVTHPTAHSREKLMTLLWGGHVEPQARQNLRQALSSLRHVLAKDMVHCDGAVQIPLRNHSVAPPTQDFNWYIVI